MAQEAGRRLWEDKSLWAKRYYDSAKTRGLERNLPRAVSDGLVEYNDYEFAQENRGCFYYVMLAIQIIGVPFGFFLSIRQALQDRRAESVANQEDSDNNSNRSSKRRGCFSVGCLIVLIILVLVLLAIVFFLVTGESLLEGII